MCNFLKPTTQNCRENRIRIDETLHKKVLENRVVNIHLLRLLMTACDLITSGGLTCSTSYICISTNTVGNLFCPIQRGRTWENRLRRFIWSLWSLDISCRYSILSGWAKSSVIKTRIYKSNASPLCPFLWEPVDHFLLVDKLW